MQLTSDKRRDYNPGNVWFRLKRIDFVKSRSTHVYTCESSGSHGCANEDVSRVVSLKSASYALLTDNTAYRGFY
jgi:hypothetical protein